ncbi:hypothetical protein VSS74_12325, partial [Conexibacter stalactiti]
DLLRLDPRAGAGAVPAALGGGLRGARDAKPAGTAGSWTLPGGSAATTSSDGAEVTLTLAPTAALARRLAR